MVAWFIGIYVRGIYAWRAIRVIRRPHLMETVTYQGVECVLIQGVQNPLWILMPMTKENLARQVRETHKVHINDFQLRPFWRRAVGSFFHTYSFFMHYWFEIDVYKASTKMSAIALLR